ncbi:acetoacetate decarboxylase family protein [Corynebacterium sp. AOP40-9SA-29]|uniref:acetoacetate decarboxylase family protein n=1 Tax=Corynebacterium sp. AOP40-9SA-29 TaxID=3457677 RepID=UPI00403448B9
MSYQINNLLTYTGMMPGNSTYSVKDLHQLWVYCRGDRAQLERLSGFLPFELQDDIFILGVGDFSDGPGWADASIILPITFNGEKGGTYYFEYEDQHASVAMGRETWGYPKAFARVEYAETTEGIHAEVTDYDTEVFSVDVTFDDSVRDEKWDHLAIYPQYQVRGVPQKNGSSFDILDVVSRDPSVDYIPKSRRLGQAKVTIGKVDIANNILDGEKLEVLEVLGAELQIGDYHSTTANGIPHVVESLI